MELIHWGNGPSKTARKCFDVVLLTAEILHHLGCIKPCKYRDKLLINWCRISAINSMIGTDSLIFVTHQTGAISDTWELKARQKRKIQNRLTQPKYAFSGVVWCYVSFKQGTPPKTKMTTENCLIWNAASTGCFFPASHFSFMPRGTFTSNLPPFVPLVPRLSLKNFFFDARWQPGTLTPGITP